MNNETVIIGCLLLVFVVLFMFHNKKCLKEPFMSAPILKDETSSSTSRSFIKFGETFLKSGFNKEKKYENSTLEQCQFKCNEDDKCIGFVRKDIADNNKDECYVRVADNVGDCHSLRKGNPEQRLEANDYNTYLKSTYVEENKKKNILTRCLGDEKLTLNKKVYIQSIAKPNNCLCVIDNNIKAQHFSTKGVDFFKFASFTIIKGLEGSGTVSFKLKDNNNTDYYLSANHDQNILELVSIKLDNANQKERSNASFELHDDPLNKGYVSIMTFSPSNDNKFVSLADNSNNIKNPRLILKKELSKPFSKEYASFNIVNYYTNSSIINELKSANQSNNSNNTKNNNKTKEVFQSTKPNKYNITPIIDVIILIDHNDNKLMIPARFKTISYDKLKEYVKKLNSKYFKPDDNNNSPENTTNEIGNLDREYYKKHFDLDHVNYVLISNNEKYSVRLYDYDFTNKSESGSQRNIFNYENEINKIGTEIKELIHYNMEQLIDIAKFNKIDTSNKNKEEIYLDILKQIGIDKGVLLKSYKDISEINMDDPEYENDLEELRRNINLGHYFRIRSIQIFDVNPKTSFDKKINKLEPAFVKKKIEFLKMEESNTDDIVARFSKYNHNKEKELKILKEMSIERELDLLKKKDELENNINNLLSEGENLKLQKVAKDYFFMNQNRI